MNTRILTPFVIATALATLGLGCRCSAPKPLTEAQEATIRQEVEPVAKAYFAAAERLDVEGTMKFFAEAPETRFYMSDGKVFASGEMRKLAAEAWGPFSSQVYATRQAKLLVLAPDAVLYIWTGRNDMVQKDGAIQRSDPYTSTALFRKLDGGWKCVFGQESGLPFQAVKPTEAEPSKKAGAEAPKK